MITPNTIQFANGVLTMIADPNIPSNAISIKPNGAGRIWGRLNGINYSVPEAELTTCVVYCLPTDKVWFDSRVKAQLQRHALSTVAQKFIPLNLKAEAASPTEINLSWERLDVPPLTLWECR